MDHTHKTRKPDVYDWESGMGMMSKPLENNDTVTQKAGNKSSAYESYGWLATVVANIYELIMSLFD